MKLKVKEGKVSDILVSRSDDKETHDHHYDVDKGESGAKERVEWDK